MAEMFDWQAPPAAISESMRIGWLNESVETGQSWLKCQRGANDIQKALDIVAGVDRSGSTVADYRSKLSPNRLKRNLREVVGALAKLRPMWGYQSDNKAYAGQALMMNQVTRAWYLESFADRSVKEALQYAAATARGWIRPIYRRDMYGTGKGDIKLLTYGSPCVLPNQLPASRDWQSAYVVHVLEEMPVAMAHGMFPLFQHRLRPTSSRYWYGSDGIRQASQGNWLKRAFGKIAGGKESTLADLLVPIRYSYIIDLTINRTGREIPMGEPGSSWAYTVPYVGQQLKGRVANETDARLYPYRRLIISSDTCITYDGPAFDWHGMLPCISFTVDDWPWEPLGFSLVHDGFELNEAITTIMRGNMDKTRAQLDPGLAYDTNAVGMGEARAYDPMQPRARVGFDGTAVEGNVFQPTVDPKILEISTSSMAMVEKLENMMDEQLGVRDAQALSRLRSLSSMDDMEKILESNGPIIEDISRSMEPPMRDLGVMVKYNILQYYNTARVMQYVGPDGVTPTVFDYNPASLVPSHMIGEDPSQASASSPIDRARNFADNLRFFILPNSLHELTQMTQKLGYIQLKKAGVKIDSQTIAEAWSIPSYGSFDGNTVLERWKAEQEVDLQFAARLKMEAGELMPPPPGAPAPGEPPPGGVGPGKPNPEGRPPVLNGPLRIQNKDGGTRSTITTSK